MINLDYYYLCMCLYTYSVSVYEGGREECFTGGSNAVLGDRYLVLCSNLPMEIFSEAWCTATTLGFQEHLLVRP